MFMTLMCLSDDGAPNAEYDSVDVVSDTATSLMCLCYRFAEKRWCCTVRDENRGLMPSRPTSFTFGAGGGRTARVPPKAKWCALTNTTSLYLLPRVPLQVRGTLREGLPIQGC